MTLTNAEREILKTEFLRELVLEGWTPPLPKDLKEPNKPKKYELSETGWAALSTGLFYENSSGGFLTEVGVTRKTKESAQIAANRLRRMMLISALAAELEGEREFGEEPVLYSLLKDNKGKWRSMVTTTFYPETVYMAEECADDICSMLNKKEFEV